MNGRGWGLSLAGLLAFTVGCTSQPVAPSGSTGAGGTVPFVGGDADSVVGTTAARGGRPASAGVVYVTSQKLYFDTFVAVDPLPMRGRFQPIGDSDGDGISETPYGPGDPGYLGGRWWADTNGNGEQDPDDHYFLCPLLGPGRLTP